MVAIGGVLLTTNASAESPDYDALVHQARNGNYALALSYLRSKQADGLPASLLSDHLIIAGWAGRDAEVIGAYEAARNTPITTDALTAVARAYRNLRNWPESISAYQQALNRSPDSTDLRAGLVMTLADAGRHREAIAAGQTWVLPDTTDVTPYLALGYAYVRAGERFGALFAFDRAHTLAPNDAAVRTQYLLALQRAGLPLPALSLIDEQQIATDDARYRRLHSDLLAEQIRLADTTSRSEAERFVVADRALIESLRLIDAFEVQPAAKDDIARIRIDRLGALYTRNLMHAVIHEYQLLLDDGIAIPPYAQRWVASAYLYCKQPEMAGELYQRIIEGTDSTGTQRLQDQQGLFYARLETQQTEGLLAAAKSMAEQQPVVIAIPGLRKGRPNNAWLDTQLMLASTYFYLDDTPRAQTAYEGLSDRAPNNSQIRIGLAQVYRARGWPRRAEEELKIAESAEPRALSVEVQQAFTAIELQEWRQLNLLADDVVQRYPENLAVQRLQHLRDVHEMAELRITGYSGESKGSQVNASGDQGFDAMLYSPPIEDNWRVFGGGGDDSGTFPEGKGRHRWQRAGVEWRARDLTLQADVSHHDYGHGDKLGWAMSGAHDLDDQWRIGWSLARLSDDTPLRALNADIDADSASAFVRWRESDRREIAVSLSAMDFSDGNRRRGLVVNGTQRIFTNPTSRLELGLELSASRNSKASGAIYFNPRADVSALPSLTWSNTIDRSYTTTWNQQLRVAAGVYDQRDYDAGGVALLSYGQRWNYDDIFDSGLTVSALRRPYDGHQETDYRLNFDLNVKF